MAEQGKNFVNLLGRIGEDPVIRYTTDGKAVANFSLATSEVWKNDQGESCEETQWHRIVVWGSLAEKVVKPFLVKGSRIDLTGKLKTREWEKDGQKHYTTEVIIDQFNGGILMLDSPKNNTQGTQPDTSADSANSPEPMQQAS